MPIFLRFSNFFLWSFILAPLVHAELSCRDLAGPQGRFGACSVLLDKWAADEIQRQNLTHPELRTLPETGRLNDFKAGWLEPMNRCVTSDEGTWLIGARSPVAPTRAQVEEAFSGVMNQAVASCCGTDTVCLGQMARLRIQWIPRGSGPKWLGDHVVIPASYLERSKPSTVSLKLELAHAVAHRCVDLNQSAAEQELWKSVLDRSLGAALARNRVVASESSRPSWLSNVGFSPEESACIQTISVRGACVTESSAFMRQEAATLALAWKWGTQGIAPEAIVDWLRSEGCRTHAGATRVPVGEIARCFPTRLGCVTP